MVEFQNERLERMLPIIADEHGFQHQRHRVEIYGVCRECRQRELAGRSAVNEPATLGLFVAFAAGLLSFLSPCVLPLVPSYIGFLTGMSLPEMSGRRRAALVHALLLRRRLLAGLRAARRQRHRARAGRSTTTRSGSSGSAAS